MQEIIEKLHQDALAQLAEAATLEAVEAVRVEALGRKGKLADSSFSFDGHEYQIGSWRDRVAR